MSNNKFPVFKGVALLTHIGLLMVLPIFMGVYIGNFLDNKLNMGNFFLLAFILVGVVVGFLNVYKVIMKDIKRNKK